MPRSTTFCPSSNLKMLHLGFLNIGLMILGVIIVAAIMLGVVTLCKLFTTRLVPWVFQTRARRLPCPPPLNPKGKLGVTLDYSFATAWPHNKSRGPGADVKRSLLFSSHLQFGRLVEEITDAQLWKMCRDAVNEMIADARQYGYPTDKQLPKAMTILAWGNEIILASSQRNNVSFSYMFADTPVLKVLLWESKTEWPTR
jgi:hypothetical protein